MANRWRRPVRARSVAMGAAMLAGLGWTFPPRVVAEGVIGPGQGSAGLSAALQTTRSLGAATIAIITSEDQPASGRAWDEFSQGAWARSQRGLVQFVRLTKEHDPGFVRAMGVTRFPTALVYVSTQEGPRIQHAINDCATAESLTTRLRSLALADRAPVKLDPGLRRASHDIATHPSPQYTAPPTLQAPAPQPQPQPQPQTLTLAPAAPTLTTSAGVVQVPGQNFVIQQGAPQVFIAPQQAPVVYVPQTLTSAPSNMLTLSAAPSQPIPSGPTLTLAPSPPTPTLMTAPAPSAIPVTLTSGALPTANVATLATDPSPTLATVTNQTLSLPANASRSRVRVRGPGLFASSLSRLGERLIRLGVVRIETLQETTLEAPRPEAPANGLATIQTTLTSPIAPPAQTLTMAPPQPTAPPPPMPTPQEIPPKHHHH